MAEQSIDYDALKKRGFLRQKQDGYFLLRTRTTAGNFSIAQVEALLKIAKKYGKDIIHPTTRQGMEVPFILFENIDQVEKEALAANIAIGTSGPRLRSTTVCPGNNWCKSGLVDTFGFFKRIEDELGIRCAYDLPHKFKIAVSGCPNRCTRAESTEIGLHGQVEVVDGERKIGYAIYLGGCGGRTPHLGFKLDKTFSEDEALELIEKVVKFYKENAKSRQRFALLLKEYGKEKFLQELCL
jgi:dissimilatory sulfite reductase (desulfoviridin) alpha/beta subunit